MLRLNLNLCIYVWKSIKKIQKKRKVFIIDDQKHKNYTWCIKYFSITSNILHLFQEKKSDIYDFV